VYLATWGGGTGSGEGQFNFITALAVDEQGNVYVADFVNTRIQKFDARGQFVTQWPTEPPAGPNGIALDSAGHVYVVSMFRHAHYVQKFDTSGHLLREWAANGSGAGEFNDGASGIAVDGRGNLYVTDPNNYRIQKFDADGNFLTAFGSFGRGQGQFRALPLGLAVDAAGNVYVADEAGRVQKFDGSSGRFLDGWSTPGVTRLIAVSDQGNIFVRDDNARTIVEYRQP
jgi:DNA-binding beta-propeller fold protein YncE